MCDQPTNGTTDWLKRQEKRSTWRVILIVSGGCCSVQYVHVQWSKEQKRGWKVDLSQLSLGATQMAENSTPMLIAPSYSWKYAFSSILLFLPVGVRKKVLQSKNTKLQINKKHKKQAAQILLKPLAPKNRIKNMWSDSKYVCCLLSSAQVAIDNNYSPV